MLHTVEIYFLLFLTYGFLGWSMEVIGEIIKSKKFVNRGFLIGPYCPIYGWGAVAITIILKRYLEDPIALFLFALVICSILEYSTSYIMEKVFKARWWDYSNQKYNINGRICLETMIPFGLLGMAISYITNPLFIDIYEAINPIALNIIAGTLFILFLTDIIISSKVISNVKIEGLKFAKDNTEEITRKVKEALLNKDWLTRRLVLAYPNLKDIKVKVKENINKAKKEIKQNIEKTKKETKKNLRDIKNKTQESVEKFKVQTQENMKLASNIAQEKMQKVKNKTQESVKKVKKLGQKK